MARATSALTILYSGGAGNASPDLSYGGPASLVVGREVMSQSWTPSTIPGITIVYAAKNAVGAGYLSYAVANHSLTWVTFSGASSTITLSNSSRYALGSLVSGFMTVDVAYGSLPVADTGQYVTIASMLDTVFGSPSANELISGVTEYRCLYLQNRSLAAASGVALTITGNTSSSTVALGSSSSGSSQYTTAEEDWYTFRSLNWAGGRPAYTKSLGTYTPRERLGITNVNGTPRFPFFPSGSSAVGDGATTGVDITLEDKYDSSGLLAAVEWGTSLEWLTIPAGKMVSFWLKRSFPPNPVIPVAESVDLAITLVLS